MRLWIMALFCAALQAAPAAAEFSVITDRGTFVNLVNGRELARPFIKLRVSPSGRIDGKGMAKAVTGQWRWENGFFCRDLYWGDEDLGFNCQRVLAEGDRIRFVADEGAGDHADFRLR